MMFLVRAISRNGSALARVIQRPVVQDPSIRQVVSRSIFLPRHGSPVSGRLESFTTRWNAVRLFSSEADKPNEEPETAGLESGEENFSETLEGEIGPSNASERCENGDHKRSQQVLRDETAFVDTSSTSLQTYSEEDAFTIEKYQEVMKQLYFRGDLALKTEDGIKSYFKKIDKAFSPSNRPQAFCDQMFKMILEHTEIDWGQFHELVFVAKNSDGEGLFQALVRQGNKHKVQEALPFFAGTESLFYLDKYGRNALHIAALEGHHELVELLSNDIPFDEDGNGFYPLHLAIQSGYIEVIRALARCYGRDILLSERWTSDSGSHDRLSPLGLCVASGNTQMLQAIIVENSDVGKELTISIGSIGTMLHLAIHSNQAGMLRFLFENQPQSKNAIEVKDGKKRTPLQLAAYLGDIYAVKILLDSNAKIDEGHEKPEGTALHYAVRGKHPAIVDLLLREGAEVYALDKDHNSPINLARNLLKEKHDPAIRQISARLWKHAQTRGANISKPIVLTQRAPENLVFGGGPINGALIGALNQLENLKALGNLKRVAGASFGALVASLLSVGYTPSGLVMQLKELYKLLESEHVDIKGKNLFNSEKLRDVVDKLIQSKTGHKNCTFKELNEISKAKSHYKELQIFALHQHELDSETVCFKYSETSQEWNDLVIADAVCASMFIPEVFSPLELRAKNEKGVTSQLTSGIIRDPSKVKIIPLEAFDSIHYLPESEEAKIILSDRRGANNRTLGMKLLLQTERGRTFSSHPLMHKYQQYFFDAQQTYENSSYKTEGRVVSLSLDTTAPQELSGGSNGIRAFLAPQHIQLNNGVSQKKDATEKDNLIKTAVKASTRYLMAVGLGYTAAKWGFGDSYLSVASDLVGSSIQEFKK